LRLRSVAPTFWLEDEKEGHVLSEQMENSECGPPPELPTEASVADALNHFADAMRERRRLLPLLTKSA
jgi:hypothetical protein